MPVGPGDDAAFGTGLAVEDRDHLGQVPVRVAEVEIGDREVGLEEAHLGDKVARVAVAGLSRA